MSKTLWTHVKFIAEAEQSETTNCAFTQLLLKNTANRHLTVCVGIVVVPADAALILELAASAAVGEVGLLVAESHAAAAAEAGARVQTGVASHAHAASDQGKCMLNKVYKVHEY
jgi:hypothetical protein